MLKYATNKWTNLAVAYLALVGGFIAYNGWAPSLNDIKDDLALSFSQAGSLSAVTGFSAGIMIMVGGLAASRWGTKNVVLLGLLCGVVGLFIFSFAGGYALAITGRVISGFSVGLLFVGTYTLAAEWFQSDRQTKRATGIMMSGDGVGVLLSIFGLAFVLTAFGWRNGIAIQAVILLAMIPIVFLFSRNVSSRVAATGTQENADLSERPSRSAWSAVKNRNVLLATIFWCGGVGLLTLITVWLPGILVDGAGWSESTAGFFSSMFSVIGMAAAFSAAFLTGRSMNHKRLILWAGLVMVCALTILTIGLAAGNYAVVALAAPVIGLGVYFGEPLALSMAIDSVDDESAIGLVNGLVIGVPWITAGTLFPYALGWLRDLTGSYTLGFGVAIVVIFALCVVPVFFLKPVAGRPVEAAASLQESI
ncbi:MFS transporter [Rhodococcus jostii]|uniref:MFS transporter n=1 Tax=Rhodococcus jostii TaxID=132919 RepID=A0ABU4CTQ9_RHOJO|nr:MFS transporter [Rhodococcus jostii]MDV6286919.1 MFS transporter [Rhodococcus jostii]